MNGKIKIFSKANMLDQNLKMTLVLVITALISIILNNTFVLGEILLQMPQLNMYTEPTLKDFILVMSGVISYVVIMPFNYGRDIWFYENARKNKLSVRKLFSYYNVRKSVGAIKITFSVQLRKFFATFLFMTPSFTLGGYLIFALRQGIGQWILIVLSVSVILLSVTGAFFSFVFCQRYFLSSYLWYENEPCRVNEIIKLSTQIMENKCFETAMLKLSFFPWWLLCVLIFPTVYVYPYYKLSISFKAITILANNT